MRPDERRKLPAPGAKPGMPQYTKADVAKHAAVGDRVWITYKDGVYDITDSGAEQRLTERRENGNDTVLGAGSPRLHKH